MPSVSFSTDAQIGFRYFTADAWIVGSRLRHDRQLDHYGTILDTSVVISGPIGPFPTFTAVHVVLLDMWNRLAALENNTLRTRTFTIDAYFQTNFKANAVLFKTQPFTILFDAKFDWKSSFTVDAFIFATQVRTFTGNAYLVQSADGTWTTSPATPNPADGTTTVFTIPPYKQGTVQAYIDGVPQVPGVDYTETNDTIGTITFTSPPPFGSVVTVHFIACGG